MCLIKHLQITVSVLRLYVNQPV